MKQYFRKIVVLLFIVSLTGGIITTYAKNNSNNEKIVLNEKYNEKKVNRILNSINKKNDYRFLIKTTDSYEIINNYFQEIDKKIKIKEYSNGNYMIRLPKNTDLINKIDIDNGILPTTIGKYNIIQPEIVEGFGYLDGEETAKLWGNNLIGANTFQEELQSKEKIKVATLDTGIDYTNTDGTFDKSINLPPVYQDNIAPITSYNIFGELNTNTTNSYIETATIDLISIDNDGGTGVDKIYYAIGTDTGSLVYVEYTEPVIVNGVGDYTLHYYSEDLFGNIEEVKTVSFSLTERPETYAGNISGYVYDDSNENGIQDEGEKFMAGWKVCIDSNNNNDCEENVEPFNLTNNNGYYEFNSLVTGTYNIKLIPHKNWELTNPINGRYTITISNGQVVANKNFGAYKTKGNK